VCGELTFRSQRQNFTPLVKKRYELYFGCKMSDVDKSWAPHICCVTCVTLLTGWVNCLRQMPFAVLKVWKEPKDHPSDCYSCLTNIPEITYKSRQTVNCPDLPSAMRPLQRLPGNLTFRDEILILMKISDSKKRTVSIAIRRLK
jgi:hypothetical protein